MTPKQKFSAPIKHWFPIPAQKATISQFNEYKAEAQRMADLRAQHAAFVQWTRQQ